MLTIDRLTHVYPGGVRALDAVSLEVPRGMFGLLGPNGGRQDHADAVHRLAVGSHIRHDPVR